MLPPLHDKQFNELLVNSKASADCLWATATALTTLRDHDVEGDVVECGVWRGAHIIMARIVAPDRMCWLFDTFGGMTEPTEADGRRAQHSYEIKKKRDIKWMAVSVSEVVALIDKFGVLDRSKLRFIVGDVSNTLKVEDCLPEKIALLRLDTDWYVSTKLELEILFPRLVKGGILIVDDYGKWEGARKAVDEYFAGRDLEWAAIDKTARLLVKTWGEV